MGPDYSITDENPERVPLLPKSIQENGHQDYSRRLSKGQLNPKYKPTLKDVWPQVVASQISLSISIQCGINLAFSGVLIPQLSNDPYMKNSFTVVEASWIASLVVISQPIGAILAGPLMDYYGRKKICTFQNVPMVMGWVITYFTVDSLGAIYMARLLAGFGAGLSLAGLVYTAEISHVSYRATLLNTNSLHASIGVLMTTIAGVYLDWHICALIFGIMALASFLLSFMLPESPYWMANFSDASLQEVKKVIKTLNKNPDVKAVEWRRIQKTITKRRLLMDSDAPSATWWESFRNTCYYFKERSSYLPFTLLLVLFLLQQASGTYVVIFYTVNIFRSIGGNFNSFFNEYTATIAVGVMKFVLSFVTTVISKVLGRRPILMASASGMAVAAFLSAILLYINNVNGLNFSIPDSKGSLEYENDSAVSEAWVMLAILLYVSSAAIGMMVIPWTFIGELLPIKVRAFGSGLMMSYGSTLMFIVIKSFPFLVDLVTLPAMFWIYSAISVISTVLIYLFLPETHEKSFTEIENYFDSSSA